ncbi:MAG: hypothetical protein ACFFDH_08740 [Promethearchaeota archaeon]
MKNIKNKYLKLGLFFLIFFCNPMLSTLLSYYNFEPNNLNINSPKFSNEEIRIIAPGNRTYTNSTPNYYNATYGFDYDAHGADPTGWTITESPNSDTEVRVIDEIDGHKKVVEFRDSSSSYQTSMKKAIKKNDIDIQEAVIEYWVRADRLDYQFFFEIFEQDSPILRIRMYNGLFEYYDGSYHNAGEAYSNTWYHIKLDISLPAGSVNLYINEELKISNGNYIGTPQSLTRVEFYTLTNEGALWTPICYYVDAVGFEIDGYEYKTGYNLNEGIYINYETEKDLIWKAYSLDNQPNKTIPDNCFMPMPEDGHHTIQLFGTDYLGTVYKSAIQHFTYGPLSINTPENRTYTNHTAITDGYYPATYGFENDAYKADPANWTISEFPNIPNTEVSGPTSIRVIDELDGHKNVVEFYDRSEEFVLNEGEQASMEKTFDAQENGIIEYWVRSPDVSYRFFFEIFENNTLIFRIRIHDNALDYWKGGSSYDEVMRVYDNIWYHIKVNISVTSDSAELFVNGTSKKKDTLYGTPNFMNRVMFRTHTKVYGYSYIDAIGFSWDPNYNVGDNFIPNGWLLDIDKNFDHEWMGYSLDGQSNVTILGDTIFPIPDEGHHTIQVFAFVNDSSGTMYNTEIRHFHIYWNAAVPDAPMNVKIHQGIKYVYLSWDIPNNNSAPIKRYNIYRGNISGGYKERIGFTIDPEYNDTDAGKYIGHRFYYIIRAENVLGESNNSDEVSGKAYDDPFIDWLTPEEDATVAFPANESNSDSLWVIFNFTYDTEGLDYVNLTLNKRDFGNVSNKNSIIFNYDLGVNGNVNATLFGYKENLLTAQQSRNFTFRKIMVDVVEKLDEGLNNTGKQLYLILHDPHGDHSFSGFSEITSFSTGVSTHISNVENVKVGASISLFGIGAGASMNIKTTVTEDYDFRLETTDISAFTSNQESEDADYIGPGRGDIYWGEVWIVHWVLKAHTRRYFGETEWVYEEPKLEYGINRSAEALLNDNNAPANWKELNPVHNSWLDVDWFSPSSIVGGVPYTFSHYTKTTESWGFSTVLEIDSEVSVGLFGFSTGLKLHFEKSNYNFRNETKEYQVSYTVHDDDPTDFIVQDVGIDKRFGTYIFRPYSLTCNTSNPLEHNTFDYIPPVIDVPAIDLDSNDDNHYPCPDDSPIVTVNIFDEGGIQETLILYSIDDGAIWNYSFLSEQSPMSGTWEGTIPAQEYNTTVLWYIVAWDNEGGKSIRKSDLGDPFEYTVIKKSSSPSAVSGYTPILMIPITIIAIASLISIFRRKQILE